MTQDQQTCECTSDTNLTDMCAECRDAVHETVLNFDTLEECR